jgi:exodeoxyribonuclease VII small subunit
MAKKNDAAGAAEAPASFESALKELESLVATLESGSLSLEQSLAAHKRGLELARYCQSTLAQAQQQVRILEEEALRAFPSGDTQS